MGYSWVRGFDGDVRTDVVLRDDNVSIPEHPDSVDWQAFKAWCAEGNEPLEPAPIPPAVPATISDRQFFQQLAKDGDCTEAEALAYVQAGALPKVLSDVIDTLPEGIRFDVKMELIGANDFARSAPTVDLLGYLLGKDAAALDGIWIRAIEL